jgi:hypothetical protein
MIRGEGLWQATGIAAPIPGAGIPGFWKPLQILSDFAGHWDHGKRIAVLHLSRHCTRGRNMG